VEGLAWEGGKVCYGEHAGLGRVVLDDGGLVDMWLACKNLSVRQLLYYSPPVCFNQLVDLIPCE